MSTIDEIIEFHSYEGILDQDGWETLELTLAQEQPPLMAKAIIDRLQNKGEEK